MRVLFNTVEFGRNRQSRDPFGLMSRTSPLLSRIFKALCCGLAARMRASVS